MTRDPLKLLAAIQARGCDAVDLRDAAHEAHHAMFVRLHGRWHRERIHRALIKRAGACRSKLISYELDARAVEWTICDRFGLVYEAEHWADIMWWEALKNMRIQLPTGSWTLDAMARRKRDPLTELYADRVEAIARVQRRAPRKKKVA